MAYKVENWVKGGQHREVRDSDTALKEHLMGNGWARVTTRDDWSPFVEKKKTTKKTTKKSE